MNKFTKLSLCLCLLATILFSACQKEYDTIQTIDDAAIQTFIKSTNLKFTKDATGYYYSVTSPGTGAVVKNSDSVYYSYTFKTLNGQVLNQSSNVMIPENLLGYTDRFTISGTSYVFTGIREVLSKLNRGGTASLILPSNLAFGRNGFSGINVGSNENILVELGLYNESKIHDINELEINNFIKANNLTAIKDPSRVRYIVTQQGTGAQVSASSTLTINYTGRLLNGTIFDSNTAGTYPTTLADVVAGWGILKNFKAGTKVRIIIPSDLGYGQNGRRDPTTGAYVILPNLNLDFDIEIVSVTN